MKVVTPEMAERTAREGDHRNLKIACRLIADPTLGITRITVVGARATYVVEPAPRLASLRAADGNVPSDHGSASLP